MARRTGESKAFYGVAVLLIAASVGVLLHLLSSFSRDLEANVEALQRVFSDENLLKNPGDPGIRFAAVEELADKYRGHKYFRGMTVTKYFGRNDERVVYPFYIPALFPRQIDTGPVPGVRYADGEFRGHPLPWDLPVDGRQLPLVARGQLLGNLYVRVDRGTLRSVQAAIALLSLLLAGAVLLFARQFRRQEHVISRTTVELDEKKRELVRLERLALAGQLSANLLHDLKKPVLNIKNEAEELEGAGQEMKSPREAGEPGRRIRNQVDTFFSILRDSTFERFVRAEGEREYVGINELIERSLALVRYERGAVEVDLRLDPAVPSVLAVPVRLVQVFSNLVLNAFQAMEGRGKLTISTAGEAGRVAVVIADTGPGIHPDALDRIFTPFYTTKPSDTGTGLGLYITRDIVDDMGGSISVESSPAGTAFRIELPAEYASP